MTRRLPRRRSDRAGYVGDYRGQPSLDSACPHPGCDWIGYGIRAHHHFRRGDVARHEFDGACSLCVERGPFARINE